MVNSKKLSWGRLFDFDQEISTPFWIDDLQKFLNSSQPDKVSILPSGFGRSYGDSCLNKDGLLIEMTGLNRLISFDEDTGVLRCEAGVSFEEILKFAVPKGWFLPVTPGTMYVSVGGAIANDIHGKNHHGAGTFGCHVLSFVVMTTDGSVKNCSPSENNKLFSATIGGLGLTGIISSAQIQLKKISSPMIDQEIIKFKNIDEFFRIEEDSVDKFEYTVSWIDSLATGENLARGLYMRGRHSENHPKKLKKTPKTKSLLMIPFQFPSFTLNRWTVSMFNEAYYGKQRVHTHSSTVPFKGYFYPLDGVKQWNLIYGNKGFRQFQFVVPVDKKDALIKLLELAAKSGMSSFLTILKKFGEIESPGMMSFPAPGYTVALDFPNRGKETIRLLDKMTEVVLSSGGKLYPAKDAYMSRSVFETCFPRFSEFKEFVDPGLMSDFWRRVTKDN